LVLGLFRRRKVRRFEDLKIKRLTLAFRKIRSAVSIISALIVNLDKHIVFLKSRIKNLTQRANDLEKVGLYSEAALVRNEVKDVSYMVKKILLIRNVLEQVKVKLETLKEAGEALLILAPTLNVLNKAIKEISKIKPEIAYQLENVRELLYSALLDLGEYTKVTIDYYVSTSTEAEKIFLEAKEIAEKTFNESFK